MIASEERKKEGLSFSLLLPTSTLLSFCPVMDLEPPPPLAPLPPLTPPPPGEEDEEEIGDEEADEKGDMLVPGPEESASASEQASEAPAADPSPGCAPFVCQRCLQPLQERSN